MITGVATTEAVEFGMAAVARLLSLGFLVPGDEPVSAMSETVGLLDGVIADEGIRAALADLRTVLPAPGDAAPHIAEYHRLFGGTVVCPPYETSYAPDPFQQARQMSDVAGFYAAFGAEPSGAAAERPDHVGCELEFLAFLMAARLDAEADGRAEDAVTCRDAEDSFLRDHLGRWLGPFCREVEKVTEDPFYAALARLGQRYAVCELERRGLRADPVLAHRIRTVVERDTFSCGAEDAAVMPPHGGGRRHDSGGRRRQDPEG